MYVDSTSKLIRIQALFDQDRSRRITENQVIAVYYGTLTYTQVKHHFCISNYVTSARHVLTKDKNKQNGFGAEGTLCEAQHVKKHPKSYLKYIIKSICVLYYAEFLLP